MLIAYVLAVDKDFQPYTSQFLSYLIENIQNTDFNTRKIAVEVIYTIAKVIPNSLKPYKQELLEIIGELRFDKMKPVREASQEALTAIKDVPDCEM